MGISTMAVMIGLRKTSKFWLFGPLLVMTILHISGWSQYPPDVDPINFVSALSHYDISHDAPHPPGYPLYVGLGRIAQILLGPNHAYQLVNLSMVIGTSLLLARIGAVMQSRVTGTVAALSFAFHPLVWAATVVPECYISDSLGGSAIVVSGLLVGRRPRLGLMLFIGVELMIGLMRPTSCILLLPVGLTAIWLGSAETPSSRVRLLVGAMIGAGLAFLVAYAITINLAGGLHVYKVETDRVMGASFRGKSILGGAPLSAHLAMVSKLSVWFVALALPALVAMAVRLRMCGCDNVKRIVLLVAAWVFPPFAFYALVYYLKPTYQLIYLPALCFAFAWALCGLLAQWPRVILGVVAFGAAISMVFFAMGDSHLPDPLYRLTHNYFRQQDRAWERLERKVAAVPSDQLIVEGKSGQVPQALRLLVPTGVYGVRDEHGGIVLNDHGRWRPATSADLSRYHGIVTID